MNRIKELVKELGVNADELMVEEVLKEILKEQKEKLFNKILK